MGGSSRGSSRGGGRACLKAITLLQPWASLVAIGAKTIETRPYATSYRGPLAIHAAKTSAPVDDPYFRSLLTSAGLNPDQLPLGAILAICRLIDCEKITPVNCPCYPEYAFCEFRPAEYIWQLSDIKSLINPTLSRGHRGLWTYPLPVDPL